MGYIEQRLWHILVKNYRIYGAKIMRCLYQKLYVNYGIYRAKLWDIMGKNNGINWAKTMGYIMGYI